MTSKPARVRLLRAILSLVLPVTLGHTAACGSPALTFSTAAAIHFDIKCSPVWRHSPSPWAEVVHWSALMPKTLRSSRNIPFTLFSAPPRSLCPPICTGRSRGTGRHCSWRPTEVYELAHLVVHLATRPWSPPSSSSVARAIARRLRHRQRNACLKVTSPELDYRRLLPPAPPSMFSSSGAPKRPWCLCPPWNAYRLCLLLWCLS